MASAMLEMMFAAIRTRRTYSGICQELLSGLWKYIPMSEGIHGAGQGNARCVTLESRDEDLVKARRTCNYKLNGQCRGWCTSTNLGYMIAVEGIWTI